MNQTTYRWIAFLRAINVGGHVVKMDALRGLFEALGFGRVETFIASGNVIFESHERDAQVLESQIERHLEAALGYPVATFLRSPEALNAVARLVEQDQPFPAGDLAGDDTGIYVAFAKSPVTEEGQRRVLSYRTEFDDFYFAGREIYWLSRRRISESKFTGGLLEKAIQAPATMRNFTTVKKLAEKYRV